MVKTLSLTNFRSLERITIDFSKNNHIYLTAPNGTGKTSILESIYLINTSKSHRTNDEKELISFNKEFAKVKLTTNKNDTLEMIISKEGKRTFINRIEITKLSEFIGNVPLVMFSPEDFNIINGTPSNRRYFLDIELTQINKKYIGILNEYRKIIKHRNNLLKMISENDDLTFLNILSNQLVTLGIKIIRARQKFINELNLILATYKILPVKIIYLPDVSEEDYLNKMISRVKHDFFLKTTSTGIHRDDFEFQINDSDGKRFASQGQKRLIVILLKLALAKVVEKVKEEDVTLLLDDVFSELDEKVQKELMKEIIKHRQVIMTGAIPSINNDFITYDLTKEMKNHE